MVSDPQIVAADFAHVDAIARDMRDADAREVFAATGWEPGYALEKSLHLSSGWAVTVMDDEGPAAMGGLVLDGRNGCPWLLGTPRLTLGRRRWFMKMSRFFFEKACHDADYLENHVDARYAASVRWLRWLGFTIEPAEPYGLLQLPFHRFHWRRA